MMTTEIELEKPQTRSYDENILNFLDYTILLLSQANTADDVDIVMDDFVSDDFYNLLNENKELFNILAPVWVDVFDRVFVSGNESSFSLKALRIPVLIKEFDWVIENASNLSNLHTKCLNKIEKDESLYNYLTLLFVEGIYFSLESAFDNFKIHANSLASSQSDIDDIQDLCDDISSLGWPQNTQH